LVIIKATTWLAESAAAAALAVALVSGSYAQSENTEPPVTLGALAPANLKKERPAAPFDLTGTWQHEFTGPDSWRFVPQTFELTPEAQRHYDAGEAARREGKLYRDDIGQCWPAGMPLIMTRVWPIAMVQLPTVIYMISHFMNSVRIIYLDGRPHSHPDIVVASFNGESIGHWEGDTLVVDTVALHPDSFIEGFTPHSDAMTVKERIRFIGQGVLEDRITVTDPKALTKPWETVRTYRRASPPNDQLREFACAEGLTREK
jgi:hypothetical protein